MTKEHEDKEFFFDDEPDPSLSRAYKNNPTIENYISLRRTNPNTEIEVAFTNGLDWLFANSEVLRENGIDPQWFASALDANEEAISKLSLHLLEKIVERSRLEKSGETHVMSRGIGISDSLVNYLTAVMLDALSWNDELYMPRDLLVLSSKNFAQLVGQFKFFFVAAEQSRQFLLDYRADNFAQFINSHLRNFRVHNVP